MPARGILWTISFFWLLLLSQLSGLRLFSSYLFPHDIKQQKEISLLCIDWSMHLFVYISLFIQACTKLKQVSQSSWKTWESTTTTAGSACPCNSICKCAVHTDWSTGFWISLFHGAFKFEFSLINKVIYTCDKIFMRKERQIVLALDFWDEVAKPICIVSHWKKKEHTHTHREEPRPTWQEHPG